MTEAPKLDALIELARGRHETSDVVAAVDALVRSPEWPQHLLPLGRKPAVYRENGSKKPPKDPEAGNDMDDPEHRAAAYAAQFNGAEATDESRTDALTKLASKEGGLRKDATIKLAREVTNESPRTKKDAMAALERWVRGKLQAGAQSRRVRESQASG